jgi:hypothetical protein
MTFLQRPAKVSELFRPGTRGVRLGEEVLLDDIGTGTTSITFWVLLPKRTRKGHQPFLLGDDGTFLAI